MTLISRAKAALRQCMRNITSLLSSEDALEAGIQVAKHIDQWLLSINPPPKAIALFTSLKDEIATAPLATILEDREIAICRPFIRSDKVFDWVPQLAPDIIIVPGLAFDLKGQRLGRGQGYYDRYLSGLDHQGGRPILLGLCLDEQLIEVVPSEKHDVVMDFICTPKRGVLKANSE